jgi:hypothetical protein
MSIEDFCRIDSDIPVREGLVPLNASPCLSDWWRITFLNGSMEAHSPLCAQKHTRRGFSLTWPLNALNQELEIELPVLFRWHYNPSTMRHRVDQSMPRQLF